MGSEMCIRDRTYDDHLRLIGKRVADTLLVLIELSSLGRTAEALRAIIGSKSVISLQWEPVDTKFQIDGVAPTHHSSSQKTRLNGLSHDIKISIDFSSVLSQCSRWTDRRADRNLIARPRPCSAVKMTLRIRILSHSYVAL